VGGWSSASAAVCFVALGGWPQLAEGVGVREGEPAPSWQRCRTALVPLLVVLLVAGWVGWWIAGWGMGSWLLHCFQGGACWGECEADDAGGLSPPSILFVRS